MTQSTPENPIEETPVDTPVDTPLEAPVQQAAASPGLDIRRRLRELLSVPERDRSDEVWDEIIELEIQLAPGNRVSGSEHSGASGRGPQQGKQTGGGGGGGAGAGGQQKKHRPRANNNRRGRQGKPPTGGGGNPA